MDWNHELMASAVWLGKAFIISVVGMTLTVLALGKYTVWGRRFKQISWAFFDPRREKLPMVWLAALIFMTLFAVRMNVLFSFWYNDFYGSMQALDQPKFWFSLSLFAVLATIHVCRALINYYLQQTFLLRWRTWLNESLVERWLDRQAYYRSNFVSSSADNPDQRIQQDITAFAESSMTLSMGMLNSVVSIFAFTLILWNLSGTLAVFGQEIPRGMVFAVYLYVIVASVFAFQIGRPLIGLNFLNEKLNANFRYALVRLREYGESIAFYRGEGVERNGLATRFAAIIANYRALIARSLKFQGYNLTISQTAVVFPIIIQAKRLFSKQITLGDLMQTIQSFGQVEDALSFFRSSYDDFATYRAVINRLAGFVDCMQDATQLGGATLKSDSGSIAITRLTVRKPAADVLVENLSFALPQSTALLIRGRSGIGKTTLLRAVAGLWPYAEGDITRPEGRHALFLPQKPYLPLGSLRQALFYPGVEQAGEAASEVLRRCHLAHLTSRLNEEADWTRILSLGEQQRVAIARVLLNRPDILFLDEASSAMDEGLEHAMYALLRESLPTTIFISVGHRSSLLEFHTHELELLGEGRWRFGELATA